MKNTREICALLEPDARFAGEVPGSPGGEGCAVPTAGGLPGSPGGDKRGRDTKVSLPLLTPNLSFGRDSLRSRV